MKDNRRRRIVFICSGIQNSEIISEEIEALSTEGASKLFENKFNFKPSTIQGPFHRKKSSVYKEKISKIVFSNKSYNAIYKNWLVKAILTEDPVNCALLLFDRRVDGLKAPKPTENIIVNIKYLKEL